MSRKLKEEPRLSGAYIRTLVKQLTPSRTKSPKDPKFGQNMTKVSQGRLSEPPETHQPKPHQQHKKQVRRRLHTTKPCQERMLNMAEARREIVAALKFHRASMKQANEQQQQSQSSDLSSPSSSTTSNLDSFPHSSSFPQRYPYAPPAMPSQPTDTLDFNLPSQTLGLNLNFHGFNNIDTNLYHNSCNNINSSSSPCVTQQVPSGDLTGPYRGRDLHHDQAMDDQYWNETMDLVTSTRWLKLLKSMELGEPEVKPENDDHGFQPFDQIMEFPSWLKPNETHHFNDLCPDIYFEVPSLPCMDIGEIEGMDDEEWLA